MYKYKFSENRRPNQLIEPSVSWQSSHLFLKHEMQAWLEILTSILDDRQVAGLTLEDARFSSMLNPRIAYSVTLDPRMVDKRPYGYSALEANGEDLINLANQEAAANQAQADTANQAHSSIEMPFRQDPLRRHRHGYVKPQLLLENRHNLQKRSYLGDELESLLASYSYYPEYLCRILFNRELEAAPAVIDSSKASNEAVGAQANLHSALAQAQRKLYQQLKVANYGVDVYADAALSMRQKFNSAPVTLAHNLSGLYRLAQAKDEQAKASQAQADLESGEPSLLDAQAGDVFSQLDEFDFFANQVANQAAEKTQAEEIPDDETVGKTVAPEKKVRASTAKKAKASADQKPPKAQKPAKPKSRKSLAEAITNALSQNLEGASDFMSDFSGDFANKLTAVNKLKLTPWEKYARAYGQLADGVELAGYYALDVSSWPYLNPVDGLEGLYFTTLVQKRQANLAPLRHLVQSLNLAAPETAQQVLNLLETALDQDLDLLSLTTGQEVESELVELINNAIKVPAHVFYHLLKKQAGAAAPVLAGLSQQEADALTAKLNKVLVSTSVQNGTLADLPLVYNAQANKLSLAQGLELSLQPLAPVYSLGQLRADVDSYKPSHGELAQPLFAFGNSVGKLWQATMGFASQGWLWTALAANENLQLKALDEEGRQQALLDLLNYKQAQASLAAQQQKARFDAKVEAAKAIAQEEKDQYQADREKTLDGLRQRILSRLAKQHNLDLEQIIELWFEVEGKISAGCKELSQELKAKQVDAPAEHYLALETQATLGYATAAANNATRQLEAKAQQALNATATSTSATTKASSYLQRLRGVTLDGLAPEVVQDLHKRYKALLAPQGATPEVYAAVAGAFVDFEKVKDEGAVVTMAKLFGDGELALVTNAVNFDHTGQLSLGAVPVAAEEAVKNRNKVRLDQRVATITRLKPGQFPNVKNTKRSNSIKARLSREEELARETAFQAKERFERLTLELKNQGLQILVDALTQEAISKEQLEGLLGTLTQEQLESFDLLKKTYQTLDRLKAYIADEADYDKYLKSFSAIAGYDAEGNELSAPELEKAAQARKEHFNKLANQLHPTEVPLDYTPATKDELKELDAALAADNGARFLVPTGAPQVEQAQPKSTKTDPSKTNSTKENEPVRRFVRKAESTTKPEQNSGEASAGENPQATQAVTSAVRARRQYSQTSEKRRLNFTRAGKSTSESTTTADNIPTIKTAKQTLKDSISYESNFASRKAKAQQKSRRQHQAIFGEGNDFTEETLTYYQQLAQEPAAYKRHAPVQNLAVPAPATHRLEALSAPAQAEHKTEDKSENKSLPKTPAQATSISSLQSIELQVGDLLLQPTAKKPDYPQLEADLFAQALTGLSFYQVSPVSLVDALAPAQKQPLASATNAASDSSATQASVSSSVGTEAAASGSANTALAVAKQRLALYLQDQRYQAYTDSYLNARLAANLALNLARAQYGRFSWVAATYFTPQKHKYVHYTGQLRDNLFRDNLETPLYLPPTLVANLTELKRSHYRRYGQVRYNRGEQIACWSLIDDCKQELNHWQLTGYETAAYDLHNIHCFDISHLAGNFTTGSAISLGVQGPVVHEYRYFNFSGLQGDDYTAINASVDRRYRKLTSLDDFASVTLIDGGRYQLQAAAAAFKPHYDAALLKKLYLNLTLQGAELNRDLWLFDDRLFVSKPETANLLAMHHQHLSHATLKQVLGRSQLSLASFFRLLWLLQQRLISPQQLALAAALLCQRQVLTNLTQAELAQVAQAMADLAPADLALKPEFKKLGLAHQANNPLEASELQNHYEQLAYGLSQYHSGHRLLGLVPGLQGDFDLPERVHELAEQIESVEVNYTNGNAGSSSFSATNSATNSVTNSASSSDHNSASNSDHNSAHNSSNKPLSELSLSQQLHDLGINNRLLAEPGLEHDFTMLSNNTLDQLDEYGQEYLRNREQASRHQVESLVAYHWHPTAGYQSLPSRSWQAARLGSAANEDLEFSQDVSFEGDAAGEGVTSQGKTSESLAGAAREAASPASAAGLQTSNSDAFDLNFATPEGYSASDFSQLEQAEFGALYGNSDNVGHTDGNSAAFSQQPTPAVSLNMVSWLEKTGVFELEDQLRFFAFSKAAYNTLSPALLAITKQDDRKVGAELIYRYDLNVDPIFALSEVELRQAQAEQNFYLKHVAQVDPVPTVTTPDTQASSSAQASTSAQVNASAQASTSAQASEFDFGRVVAQASAAVGQAQAKATQSGAKLQAQELTAEDWQAPTLSLGQLAQQALDQAADLIIAAEEQLEPELLNQALDLPAEKVTKPSVVPTLLQAYQAFSDFQVIEEYSQMCQELTASATSRADSTTSAVSAAYSSDDFVPASLATQHLIPELSEHQLESIDLLAESTLPPVALPTRLHGSQLVTRNFVSGHVEQLSFGEGSNTLLNLIKARDAAHDYANKKRKHKIDATLMTARDHLQNVKGLGEASVEILFAHYGTSGAILAALENNYEAEAELLELGLNRRAVKLILENLDQLKK